VHPVLWCRGRHDAKNPKNDGSRRSVFQPLSRGSWRVKVVVDISERIDTNSLR